MGNEEKFDSIYKQMESGVFDKMYYDLEKGNVIGISVKNLKKHCNSHDVDFDTFLKYAQNRKKEENK